jgi:hypothetical protein
MGPLPIAPSIALASAIVCTKVVHAKEAFVAAVSSDIDPSLERAAAAGHQAASWLIAVACQVEQAPAMLWAFSRDVGASLFKEEARRGLFVICITLIVGFWLSVRLMRALLYRIARGVVIDVLRDEQVSRLATGRFVAMMAASNRDPGFKDSFVKCLWSESSKTLFKSALTELLLDEHFVGGIANLIRGLTGIDFLKDAVKTQIRETLKDQNIHRALLEGSLEALKPKWMQNDKEERDDQPSTPVPPQGAQRARQGSRACV